MGASLLPSKRLAALAGRARLAALPKKDGSCAGLCAEFGLRGRNAWFIVIGPKGGVLGQFTADTAGSGCTQETVDRFPDLVADRIEEALKRTGSVDEAETRWLEHPSDEAAMKEVRERLEEMGAFDRLERLCGKIGALENLAPGLRIPIRYTGILARTRDPKLQMSGALRQPFVDDATRLLVDAPSRPEATDLLRWLFTIGCARRFDMPAKSAACVAGLEAGMKGSPEAEALRKRILEFKAMSEASIAQVRKSLEGAAGEKQATLGDYARAQLGDAEAAIRLLSKPGFANVEFFQSWLAEAKAKLAAAEKR